MMNKHNYNIVISSDANYLVHAETLIASIEDNVQGDITIYVLSLNIPPNLKHSCRNKFTRAKIEFIDITIEQIKSKLSKKNKLGGYMSLASYGRLLIPELIPSTVKKCLYIDVDGIILNDLDSLWEIDLKGYALAAVKDTNHLYSKTCIGLNAEDLYINAGLILWNLAEIRDGLVDTFANFIEAHNGDVFHMDQGVINGSLKGRILELPTKYNVTSNLFYFSANQCNKFYHNYNIAPQELREARERPVFVHFVLGGSSRPWQSHCKHPLKDKYWKYRLGLGYPYTLEKDTRDIKQKLVDWANRNFSFVFSIF